MCTASIHHDPSLLRAMPANITCCAPGMFVTRDFHFGEDKQLLDEAASGIVHQFVDARAGVLDQIEQRQQHLTVLRKTGFQRALILLVNDAERHAGCFTILLGMLHFGGSPVRGVGPGNPILSDSQREPPPSTFNYGWDIALDQAILDMASMLEQIADTALRPARQCVQMLCDVPAQLLRALWQHHAEFREQPSQPVIGRGPNTLM